MEIIECFFKGCNSPAQKGTWRCHFHRGRGRCGIPNCHNQAYARKLCARHGGKRKCQVDGCTFRARVANFCAQHGEKRTKALCRHDGCINPAQLRHLCVKHGGGRYCKLDDCTTFARRGGYCAKHIRMLREEKKISNDDGMAFTENIVYQNEPSTICWFDAIQGIDDWSSCDLFQDDVKYECKLTEDFLWESNADILDFILKM